MDESWRRWNGLVAERWRRWSGVVAEWWRRWSRMVPRRRRRWSGVVGKMQQKWEEWRSIMAQPRVLEWVRYGVSLPLPHDLALDPFPPERTPQDADWLRRELTRLLDNGAIRRVQREELKWCSPVFLVPKKGPKRFRLVIDMRSLNAFLPSRTFKYEGLGAIIRMLGRGWWMASWDLRDGYHHISMAPQAQAYLGFQALGELYTYQVLPFGASISPWVFTKAMRQLLKWWRSQGMTVSAYLDDFLVAAESEEELRRHMVTIEADMARLGIAREPSKGHWQPTTSLTHLGLQIDTVAGLVIVPPEKRLAVQDLCRKLLQKEWIQQRELAKLTGTVISLHRAFPPARLLTRSFYQAMQGDWEARLAISEEMRTDAGWLLHNIHLFGKAAMWRPSITRTMSTDASNIGWGAVLNGERAGGQWDTEEHINAREMRAMLLGLQTFGARVQHQRILILSDSRTAVQYVNSGGGRVEKLTRIAREIWEWAVWNGAEVRAEWIPGEDNGEADEESRVVEEGDWRVRRDVFVALNRRWGPIAVDRFADQQNTQTTVFNSRRWCPGSAAVDAFTQDWSGSTSWLAPPFALIHRALRHVQECNAVAVIVVPVWQAQPWWPLLLAMRREMVFLQPEDFLPGPSKRVEPTERRWQMAAVKISW